MLETVKLPTRVSNLDSGLPHMDGETLPHLGDLRSKLKYWGSEAGARCAADPRLSRGAGGRLKMAGLEKPGGAEYVGAG